MKPNLFLNPFTRIAGWPALAVGMAVMALTAVAGSLSGIICDGAIDIHYASHTMREAFVAQAVAWLSVFVMLLVAGLCFARTKFRVIDLAGTAALSRLPLLLVVVLGFLPIMRDGGNMLVFILICVAAIGWMIVWMYNGYALSCRLSGLRGGLSFAGALIGGEVLSKVLLGAVMSCAALGVEAAPAEPFKIPEGQTIQQTAAKVMDAFAEGKYGEITPYFDEAMRKGLSGKQLAALWMGLKIKFGKFESCTADVKPVKSGDYRILLIPCKFKNGEIRMQFAFDDAGRICGLYLK